MENAEKVQEVSPEEVQQEAESSTEVKKEVPVEDTSTDTVESLPEAESSTESSDDDQKPPMDTTSEAVDPLVLEGEEATQDVESKEAPEEPVVADTELDAGKAEDSNDKPSPESAKESQEGKVSETKNEETTEENIEGASDDHHVEAEEEEEEEEELDFANASKKDLLKALNDLSKEEQILKVDRTLKLLKPCFDELYENERVSALNKFELEGNDPDSFEYHGDDLDKEFNDLYSKLRSKRNKFYKELESQRDDNLKLKQDLLEKLREIVDGEESNTSINSIKEIQAEWKKTGPVPGAHNKTLWANYNALLDRFYDQRSIYFELKDLDRKKNLKVKIEICERAEALAGNEDLKSAIVQLNELHEEYKHVGSIPREDQEPLWQRFKAASDAIYSKRKDYFDHLKEEFEKNYEVKKELAVTAESYITFDSESITEWNHKTKEIQELQKKWEAIGGLPRDKAKAVNKQFWGSFKKFFNHKNQFFKRLEGKRDENLVKKQELIAKAEELKESSDWAGTTQKYKALQAQWKDIGPVPEKLRSESYKQFKTACDHFFERRRAQNSEQDKQYEENLKLKLQICDQIEAIAEKDEINLDDVYDLIDNHSQLGFVPRNSIKKERARYDRALDKILSLEELQEGDKADLKNHIQLSRMKNSPGGNKKFQRKEHSIKRKISELENDITTWNTNMEFFASSAAADKLKADLQKRINSAKGELEDLKSQLATFN
jgi:hypothetical protein